ncbi:CPBP family intramembrane metalloprotease [Halobacteriales archaeon QS_8_69_26]|nr:MAG: CPBP family intramembrane metalloprotease [Halobacteriales archaeon QS_8_69_26]
MSVDVGGIRARLPTPTWVQASLLVGAVLTVGWNLAPGTGIDERLVRDGAFFLVGPLTFALVWGKGREQLGWTVNRRAVRNTLLLSAFVFPFYLVGSSLPSIRAYYPMWGGTADPASFVPHATKQMVIVVAAETYYRGLLCVGVRDVGPKAALISPVVYALHHAGKPPIELALSGPTDALFGIVDYDAKSILPSVVAHGFGMTLLDWLVLHDPVIPPDLVVRSLRWLPIPL